MAIRRLYTALVLLLFASTASLAAGDAARGAQAFRVCAACHSLTAGDHRTGPSLAKVFGRRAGTADGFQRYSAALRKSTVDWNDKALDDWLRDPDAFIPGNTMAFRGLPDARVRGDLVAYLRAVSEGNAKAAGSSTRPLPDLKQADLGQRITAIRHCGDTYHVTFGDGEIRPFWEFNLRIKTDSSPRGPFKGRPVMVSSGMGGDRAQVVFASPGEISSFIQQQCP